jgi:two-component system cell cycle sensor histidine kinase/response regulator CckA
LNLWVSAASRSKKTIKARIALLEKNPLLALDIQKTLGRAGYETEAVFSRAQDCLAAASDTAFDLLIADRSLRSELALLAKNQKTDTQICTVPYICLANLSDASPNLEKDGEGALGILIKPFSAKDLLGTLEIALYRARMEKRLSAEEKRYRELFNFSLSPRCLMDADGRVVEANGAFRELFYSGKDSFSLKDYFVSSSDWNSLNAALAGEGTIQGREFDMKNSKGQGLRILASISSFDDPRYGRLLSCEFFDLTEAQRLREELLQSQKMEALGKLAGGIAHDFNNILTTIVGHTEMLRMDLGSEHAGNEEVKGISAATGRATKLTRQLLGFSRKQPYKPKTVDISQLLIESEDMLKKLAGESVLFSLHLPREALSVIIDPIQIEQALMNLVVNARDALQGKPSGSITVFALRKKLKKSVRLRGQELKPGEYVIISVADNGCGISPVLADKIFDPFFTTKALHKGTGLGLAIVNSVIGAGGGGVELISREGEGSEFRLWLPLCSPESRGADSEAEEAEGSAESGDPARGEGLELPKGLFLLVVDDDEDLLGFLAYIASKAGARVSTARNGGEALMLAENKVFQALVIDINLPGGLDGFLLYDRLKNNSSGSNLPCVFISGRMDERENLGPEFLSSAKQKSLTAGSLFLEKPFAPSQLIKAILTSLGSGKNLSV